MTTREKPYVYPEHPAQRNSTGSNNSNHYQEHYKIHPDSRSQRHSRAQSNSHSYPNERPRSSGGGKPYIQHSHANGRPKSNNGTHEHHNEHRDEYEQRGGEKSAHRKRKALKNHFVAATGEFVGTFMFLYFAFAAHMMIVNNTVERTAGGGASSQTIVFISLAYGFSLLVNAWGFYRISGGLFNPAVTFGMCLAGELPWIRGAILLVPQILGGVVAAALVRVMFPGDISEVNTTLGPGTSIVQGLFIEMFLTALLVHIVLMLAAEKTKATFMAPVGIGLALFVAELAGVGYTGGSLNPTRSFAPSAAGGGFLGYQWIYWLGPALGACLSAGYFRFAKYFAYEEANPGQDAAR